MQALQLVQSRSEIPKVAFMVIHERAMAVAKDIKDKYLEFFEVLLLVESQKIYQQMEVTSLTLYCTEFLELSPQITKDFSVVVKKSLEIPALANAVRAKAITVSKARKICPVLTDKNYKEWIDLAATCSTRIIERCVAQANPKEAFAEIITYASEERLELKLGISEEWAALLKQTKNLLSQKLKRNVDSEDALLILMKEFNKKNDPAEKALRFEKRKQKNDCSRSKAMSESTKEENREESRAKKSLTSRYVPASVEHEVTLRDGNRCSYINSKGQRCESQRWLQKHHIKHFANGGQHTVKNLETLCSAHHKIKHLIESN